MSEDFTGRHAALETTAAEARLSAPNKVEALHVSENVESAKYAANQAASVAKTLGPNYTGEAATAVDQFKADASRTTEAAISEGKRDVQQAKEVGAGYVEQAKSLANSALDTAQNYLPTSLGGKPPVSTSQGESNLIGQVKSTVVDFYASTVSTAQPPTDKLKGAAFAVTDTAQSHIQSAKNTVRSAYDAANPHIETIKSAVTPHLENARLSAQAAVDSALPHIEDMKAKVQDSMGMGADAVGGPDSTGQKTFESVSDIPSTSAPLESGPNPPYPTTTTNPLAKNITERSPIQTRN